VATIALAGAGAPASLAQEPDLTDAIRFRERFGLSTSPDRIERLDSDAAANREFDVPLTAEEAEEMHRRGRISPALDDLHVYIAEHPDDFGGVFIDNPRGGVVVLEVTEQAKATERSQALDLIPGWIEHDTKVVQNSIGELDGTQEAINDLIRKDDDRVSDIVGIDHVIRENVLRIRVLPRSMDATRSFLRERFGEHLLRFEQGGYDQGSACTDRKNCWQDPLRGGLYYSPDACTTGFLVYTEGGTRRMLTAGHCTIESGNDARYHDGHSLGKEGPNSFYDGSYSDLAVLNMASDEAQGMSGHVIYRTNSDKSYSISAQDGPSTLGEPLNMAGQKSGSTWGEVISVNHTSNWGGGFYLFYMKVGDYEHAAGDSGAPVVYDHTAVGVHSGCVSDPGEACDPDPADTSQDSTFSSIDQLWVANDGGPSGTDFHLRVCRSGDSETSC
jgi:hypothetical protein